MVVLLLFSVLPLSFPLFRSLAIFIPVLPLLFPLACGLAASVYYGAAPAKDFQRYDRVCESSNFVEINFADSQNCAIFAVPIKGTGVWRSWLAHLVWDQRVLCSSHSTPTKRVTKSRKTDSHAFSFSQCTFLTDSYQRIPSPPKTSARARSGRRQAVPSRNPWPPMAM